jgi:WD40 repeat protein
MHDEAYITLDDRHLVTTDYRRCSYSFFNLQDGVQEHTVDWCELEQYKGLETEKIEISPDGSLMAVEYQGGILVIWDVLSSEIIYEATNPNPPLRDFAFHPNNSNYALLTSIPGGYSLSIMEPIK